AVAARDAARRWPESFGPVQDRGAYTREITALNAKLEATYAEMRQAYGPADLLVNHAACTAAEKLRGVAQIAFRRGARGHMGGAGGRALWAPAACAARPAEDGADAAAEPKPRKRLEEARA